MESCGRSSPPEARSVRPAARRFSRRGGKYGRSSFRLPLRKPARSSTTRRNPASRTAATTASRSASSRQLAISAAAISRRACPARSAPGTPEAQRAKSGLGPLDLREPLVRDRRPVREARGEARRRRLVPGRKPGAALASRTSRFDMPASTRGWRTRCSSAAVPGTKSPGRPRSRRRGSRRSARVRLGVADAIEVVLAEVAAVRRIARIVADRHLVGRHDHRGLRRSLRERARFPKAQCSAGDADVVVSATTASPSSSRATCSTNVESTPPRTRPPPTGRGG